jgi:CheY-like chemotaxis protein/anti-sigma regulatory factor (Ser/Thr protein kinase)
MKTVLIVDDSQVDRRLVGGLLQRTGEYQLVYAVNGKDALDRLELDVPDAVVTDLHMPEMNGLELVESVRMAYPLVPIVLMTAQGSEELAVEALKRGAASYVTKRRIGEDLLQTLEQVMTAAAVEQGQSRLRNRVVRSETSYVLTNETALVQAMVQQIREMLRSMRFFGENDRLRIGIALEESLLNALYHGNLEVSSKLREEDHSLYEETARERMQLDPYRQRHLYVDVKLSPERAVFTIRDEGPGFNPGAVPDPTDPEFLERPCGRGMLLMRSFMDEVSYNETGNQVTMMKVVKEAPVPDETDE